MPQMQFPFFPEGVTHITELLAFARQDGQVTYFNGDMPLFVHEASDLASFRMITAQFVVNGCATQAQIARAFGKNPESAVLVPSRPARTAVCCRD